MTIRYMCYFVLFLLSSAFSTENDWEYLGPDSVEFTALYSFGNGHLIAGCGDDQQKTFRRSRDYGETWEEIPGLPVFKEVRCFMFHQGILWAGIMSWYPSLYYSLDTGKTWIGTTPDGNPINYPFSHTYCMAAKDSTIVVGAYNEWGRSTDMGKTWQSYNSKTIYNKEWGAVYCMLNFRDTLFIGTTFGVWASTDWGLNWELREGGSGIFGISLAAINEKIFVGTMSSTFWMTNSKPLTNFNLLFKYKHGVNQIYTINEHDLYISQTYSDTTVLFFSPDTGNSWKRFYLKPEATNIHAKTIYNDEKYIYTGTIHGLYRKNIDNTQEKKYQNQSIIARIIYYSQIVNFK